MNIMQEHVDTHQGAAVPAALARTRARILPREQGALALDLVIGVMAFLAALALGAVLISERTAHTWQAGLAGRLTIQILPQGSTPPAQEVTAALNLLRN